MLDINKIKKENLINTTKTQNELLEYLKKNYPQTISDNIPNLNAIADLLGLNTKTQGYELTFTGKSFANALYNTPNTKELKFEKKQSKDEKSTKNIIIKGDNLDALKLLKQSYYEKIKMIYIDPPYNTKNDEFIYQDDFRKDYKKLLLQTGLLEIDEDGNEIESETLKFFRNIKSSKTHSAWLAFMLPRLKLARDLLREDGVIFISIDDNEQANLKILCDEIFGEENFVADFIWRKKYGGGKGAKLFVDTHEYILVYAKNKNRLNFNLLSRTDKQKEVFEMVDEYFNERGKYYIRPLKSGLDKRETLIYPIECPDGSFIEAQWICGKEAYKKLQSEGRIVFKLLKNGTYNIYKKFYEYDSEGVMQESIIYDLAYNADGKVEIKQIFNIKEGREIPFSNPKSIKLIYRFLELSTNDDDIILDFFAGSGTTAQAVMELNAEDNGNRKFILVQLDEKIDEKKSKIAYDFCKNELNSQNPVISDITIERVKRASEKIAKENKNLDLGFKVFSMVEKPELISDDIGTLSLENHANLSPYEKALNLALQDCKTLDNDIKMILKDKIYQCEQSFYVVKFDDEVLNFLKNTQNENVYINGFDDINLEIYLNLESFLKERLKVVY